MTFDLLIACGKESRDDIETILRELLSEALEANQYDFDDYALIDMVQITHVVERSIPKTKAPEVFVTH